jgi:predicted RNase H-like nuclease (RuvC/YqgF family)
MSPIIETDLRDILNKLDTKFDKLETKIDNLNDKIEKTNDRLTKLEISNAEIKGEIKTLDEKLSGKVDALDNKVDGVSKRLDNQEFTSRGILIGLVLAILGGFAKLFGIIPN